MLIINAKIRKFIGKSSSRRLRKKNKFPAIIYGNNKININIELEHDYIKNIIKKKNIYFKHFFININNNILNVKIKDIQWHSIKLKILHIDFLII
ncbi:50S ribosomal protein L25 [Enterobacterales bacterium endosymbiont of Anomoneura mori]|uniref:50S ribosomal protein L25 n=1 Tax=Enterobacterales bacterium endosymbiont of Anomoneura mori TaxID=3132096 RepID=UPI00399CA5D4